MLAPGLYSEKLKVNTIVQNGIETTVLLDGIRSPFMLIADGVTRQIRRGDSLKLTAEIREGEACSISSVVDILRGDTLLGSARLTRPFYFGPNS